MGGDGEPRGRASYTKVYHFYARCSRILIRLDDTNTGRMHAGKAHSDAGGGSQGERITITRVNDAEELLSVDLDHAINAPVELLEELGLDVPDAEDIDADE